MQKHYVSVLGFIAGISLLLAEAAGCELTARQESTAAAASAQALRTPQTLEITRSSFFGDVTEYPELKMEFTAGFEQKFGIRLKVNALPANGYMDKVNLMVSSGEITGILNLYTPADVLRCKGDGVIEQLDGYLRGNAVWEQMDEKYRKLYYYDNATWAVGMGYSGGVFARSYRQDWLDKLQLKVPETVDELAVVARAFTENDPDGNGKNDTFGLTGAGTGWNLQDIFQAFDARLDNTGSSSIVWDPAVNSWIDTMLKPEMIDALNYVNKLYTAKYIDPEIFTNKSSIMREKITTGKAGSLFYWHYWAKGNETDLKKTFPNARITEVLATKGRRTTRLNQMPMTGTPYVLLKGTELPKETMETFLNTFIGNKEAYTMARFGIEGRTWKSENGEIVLLLDPVTGSPMKTPSLIGEFPQYNFTRMPWVYEGTADEMSVSRNTNKQKQIDLDAAVSVGMVFNCPFDSCISETRTKVEEDVDKIFQEAFVKAITGEVRGRSSEELQGTNEGDRRRCHPAGSKQGQRSPEYDDILNTLQAVLHMGKLMRIKEELLRRINLHSLKTRLVLSILLLFTVLILILILNNVVAVNIITQKTNDSILNSVRQTNNYITLLLKKAMDSSLVLSLNESLVNYNNQDWKNITYNYENVKLSHELDDLMLSNIGVTSEITSMFIYFDANKKLILSNQGFYNYEDIKDSTLFRKAMEVNKPFGWVGYLYEGKFTNKHMITLTARADLINKRLKSKVYVGVNFDEAAFYNIIKDVGITPNSRVYLLDENQRIVSAEDKKVLGRPVKEIVNANLDRLNELTYLKMQNSGSYQTIFQKNPYADWGILTCIPERELLAEQRTFWYIVLGIIVLVSLLIIFMTYRIISNYVDKPVNKLVRMMKQVETGNFTHQITEQRRDEFGYLYDSYNSMVRRTGQLIKELYEEKLLKKDIELRVLQSQINPHFLYNTLECINWIAKVNKVDDISHVVVALSNLYRATFNHGEDFAPVSTVVQTIENYLYIQKFRFGNRFDYRIDVETGAENLLMPNLLLQPVVENAVLHGVGECNRKGTIEVSIGVDDNILCMGIRDNGAGMSPEKLELLRRSMTRPGSSGGSAVRNVHKRIELFYGSEYGLELDSAKDGGTTATIRIPYFSYANSLYSVGETPKVFLNSLVK